MTRERRIRANLDIAEHRDGPYLQNTSEPAYVQAAHGGQGGGSILPELPRNATTSYSVSHKTSRMRASPEGRMLPEEALAATEGADSELRRELVAAEAERKEQLLVLRRADQRRREAPQGGRAAPG